MEKDEPRKQSRLTAIPGHVKDFIKTKIAYYKLTAIEGGVAVASGAVLGILLFFLGIFFLVFICIAIALAIGSALDNNALGFLIVAGIFLLKAVLIFVFRDKLITGPITNTMIKMGANNNNEADEQDN